ncbi:MAG: MBOAT family O-acyltransferase, partial [bacterium]
GLSFHTFQALSYSIEVYRGNHKAERHFGIYALYVMFYPQLVAGPIERPQNMLHQFYEKHHVDFIRIANGLKLMAWGLFKKVVIADRLAIVVNQVYDHPQQYEGTALIIATLFFAFQIYCDFSGYTDIALGAAEVMGFKLLKNFNAPYLAKNIADFWKRWHISLSTWFRDYLYISIGGSKVKISRWYFNLLFVFIVSGFWHGANWTFIIWGALNGVYLVAALLKDKFFAKKKKEKESSFSEIFQIVTTFILVSFAWIFFRANSWSDAWYIVTHLTSNLFTKVIALKSYLNSGLFSGFFGIKIKNFDFSEWVMCFVLIVILFITDMIINRHGDIVSYVNKKPAVVRWVLYYVIILSIIFLGKFGEAKFIYFQF